jgi:nitronate monooxygenase
MSLAPDIRAKLTLPAICAPMFMVTGPSLVTEACKAGVMGGLPRQNARTFEQFEGWLKQIRGDLDRHAEANPGAKIAPIAVNISRQFGEEEFRQSLDACFAHGVEIFITVGGDPAEIVKQVHDRGGKVFHDVTSMRFAEKAIAANCDGLTCIGAGGGGHSGTISHLAFVPQVRAIYDGTIVLAGAVSTGAVIRAAELLGADLAYLGTRFIATKESDAPQAYKDLLVSQTSSGLVYTPEVAGVAANWIIESLRMAGLDPAALPQPLGKGMRHDHLPDSAKPWVNLWSAGQGIDLITDIPTVAELVSRLRREYIAACHVASMEEAAILAEQAMEAAGL